MDLEKEIFDDADQASALPPEFAHMSAEDVVRRSRLLDNEIRVLKDESTRLGLEQSGLKDKARVHTRECAELNMVASGAACTSTSTATRRLALAAAARAGAEAAGAGRAQIKENKEKLKLNNQLPYLVGNVVEVLDVQPEDEEEEDGAAVDLDAQRRGKCVVLKTSTRQTIFLPVVGLVDAEKLRPGDLVGVNKARPCRGLCRAYVGQPSAG